MSSSREDRSAAGATLGQALAELEARLFVGREPELAVFGAWLAKAKVSPGLIHVWGPGGSGKSTLLRAFGRMAEASGRPLVFVDGQDVRPEAHELAMALGGATLDAAVERMNAARPVVLIDTFERLVDLTRVLQREVLPHLDAEVRLVIAGRHPLGLAWGPWRQIVRELPLGGLAPAEVREYLSRREIRDTRVVEQAVAAAGGLPLAVSLVSDLVLQHRVRDLAAAPEWHRLVRSLVEQLLHDINNPVLRELLEAGAVLRQFDEATLAAATHHDDIGESFAQLCQLSIVRPGAHGLQLHDDIRHILTQDLQWREPQRFTSLRLRALDFYRRRMRQASLAEREWLLSERLALWENAFVQTMLFTEADVGRVWLDWGHPEDQPELRRIWTIWVDNWLSKEMRLHVDRAVDRASMDAIFRYPATRVRLARDLDNRVIGFSTAVPLCTESVPLIEQAPGLRETVHAYVSHAGGQLPRHPSESNAYFFVHLAHDDTDPVATQQALIRDVFGLFARGGIYVVTTPIPTYQQLFEALGFQRLREAQSWFWSAEQPEEGYMLDLTAIGFERWIDAIVAGRRPPHAMGLDELERSLAEDVLPNWHDDERLAVSPLASYLLAHQEPTRERAAQLRATVEEALKRRVLQVDAERGRALRALEEAYLRKSASNERVAEDLAVSRSTFYRLLRRGAHELALALEATRVEDDTS